MSKILGVKKYMGNKPQFITFIKVSEYCNINCSFCYQGAPEGDIMDTQEKFNKCFENLDFILNKFRSLRKRRDLKKATMSICFFGGEPTVNPKGIIKISEYIRDNHSDLKDILHMTFTTNGTNYIPKALESMSEASNVDVSIMISSDYKKCISDKNRKFKNSDRSVYDVTQENINKYIKKLNEINGRVGKFVLVSSVMGDIEDLEEMEKEKRKLGVIKEDEKDIFKSVIRPLMTHNQTKEELKEMNFYLDKVKQMYITGFRETIKNLKHNKDILIETLVSETFGWNASIVGECNLINAIRHNGELAFCNKNNTCFENGEEISVQDNREKVILNLNYDTRKEMECTKRKFEDGIHCKGEASREALNELCDIFTFRYTLDSIVIDSDIDIKYKEKINDWIYYYSTEEMPVLINSEAKMLIDEENKKNVKFVDFIDEYGFYINKNGEILGSVLYETYLSSLKDINFMWLDAQNLYKSSIFLKGLQKKFPITN